MPKLRASGSVRQSPAPSQAAQILSPSPLTPGSPSFSKPRPSAFTAFVEPNRHPSVPPSFSKSIRYPSGPPFSKANNEIPAAHVSKPTHLAPISVEAPAPSSSSEPHDRPPVSPLTYPLQSNSQPSAPRSVTSSSLRVPSYSKPGSKASASISPPKSNVKPHPPRMAHDVMDMRKDMPAVRCSDLIRLAGH